MVVTGAAATALAAEYERLKEAGQVEFGWTFDGSSDGSDDGGGDGGGGDGGGGGD